MFDTDYVEPWMYGRASDLDKVCSIYGTQGFESDYVGVIWGRDYVYRNGALQLGDPNRCFDRKYKLVTDNGWCEDALTFMRNRYRVFLTRGRLGTFVYCEDDETREYLQGACG